MRPLWHDFRSISEVRDMCLQATSFENVVHTGNHQCSEMENSEGALLPWDLSHTLKVALKQFIS